MTDEGLLFIICWFGAWFVFIVLMCLSLIAIDDNMDIIMLNYVDELEESKKEDK